MIDLSVKLSEGERNSSKKETEVCLMHSTF